MTVQTNDRYRQRQQKIKAAVEHRIATATDARGLLIIFTGNGKGKSSAAFGTVTRAVGHGQRAAVVQFIKGEWECGEQNVLSRSGVEFQTMSTGFTWDTQNKVTDTVAAQRVWQHAKRMLADKTIDLVVLDEITYMITYGYIVLNDIVDALQHRPTHQSVILTGRGCHRNLIELADTVTEMRSIKHAFDNGLKARKGIDW